MSENEYQESYHFITSHPEAVARQMTHLIVGKRELEVRVKQLEAALQWINMQRYTDRSTITPDNAFERAISLNDQLVMIMDKARTALNPTTQEKTND
jgi:CHASE3 domain sensor protein